MRERRAARALGRVFAACGIVHAALAAWLVSGLSLPGWTAAWVLVGGVTLAALGVVPQRLLPRGIVVLSGVTALWVAPVLALPWSWALAACGACAMGWGLVAWAGRSAARPRLLLSALPLGLALLVATGVELHGRRLAASWVGIPALCRFQSGELPDWGGGGRLRPGLDVRTVSFDHPYLGARVVTNAQGFRNVAPVSTEAPAGQLRVLSLGDSFSAGYWMDQGEFFGARLEAELRQRVGGELRVLSADVMDPAHGLYYYQEFGHAFAPDLVVLGLCMNDPLQAEQFFGADRLIRPTSDTEVELNPDWTEPGWDRFSHALYPRQATPDAAAKWLQRPKLGWRGLAGQLKLVHAVQTPRFAMPSLLHSFTLQFEERVGRKWLIDGSSNLGFFLREDVPEVEGIVASCFEVLARLNQRVRASGSRLWIVLYPPKFRVHPVEWELMCAFWNLEPADFDLDRWERRLAAHCAELEIGFTSFAPALRAEAERAPGSLYLPLGDVHLNARGYRVSAVAAAEAIAGELKERRN